MAIVNLRQASAYLGFRTTTTLRRLLQVGELSTYVRSVSDLRTTYLDVAPKGRPALRQHIQAHTSCRGHSPLWGVDCESWLKESRNGLRSPTAICTCRNGAATVDRAAVGDAEERD